MRTKAAIAVVFILAIGSFAGSAASTAGADTATANQSTFCTWGGTVADPTGYFTLSPGLTNIPLSQPSKLYATGELSGGGRCEGKMTFKGVAEAGSVCPAIVFDGKVEGVPGVASFSGLAAGPVAHEFLYDRAGRVVGSDQPQVLTDADHYTDCTTPEGFTWGNFSSTVEFYPEAP